jgi:hypothetical protein
MTLKQLPPKEAIQKFDEIGLKVQSVYITNPIQYGKHAIFINRIANGNRPKFRIIDTENEYVKNCIKITYHPDKWDKRSVERLIHSRLKMLAYWSQGSCHNFINQELVKRTLTAIKKA